MNSEVYTVRDIMVILGIGKNVAYDFIKTNAFPVIKIKSSFRIPKKPFEEWLNSVNNVVA